MRRRARAADAFTQRGLSAPLVEVVVLQPEETFASTCADAPLTSDDPAVLYCPTDGASGTLVARAEAMLAAWTGLAPGMQGLPAGDFSAGFALAHGFARHVAAGDIGECIDAYWR